MKVGVTSNLISAPRINEDISVPLFLRRETNSSVNSATRTYTWVQQPIAGNLIIIILQTTATRSALTWPDGFNYIQSLGVSYSSFVFWKIAGQTEPPATFTFNLAVGGIITAHEYINANHVEDIDQATATAGTTGFYENEFFVNRCTLLNVRLWTGTTVIQDTNYEKETYNDSLNLLRDVYYIYGNLLFRMEIINTSAGYRNILLKISKNGTN
jgi:hypothetical protein